MVHFIQLVLPLYRDERETSPAETLHSIVKAELTRHFGRCDAHTLNPAQGRWKAGGQGLRDDMVIYEVMSCLLDDVWWEWYRQVLETRFQQVQVVIRTLPTF